MVSAFVEACKQAAKVLEFVKKALDEMAFAVKVTVIEARVEVLRVGRDDTNHALRLDPLLKGTCGITTVGNQILERQCGHQFASVVEFMRLSRAQSQA